MRMYLCVHKPRKEKMRTRKKKPSKQVDLTHQSQQNKTKFRSNATTYSRPTNYSFNYAMRSLNTKHWTKLHDQHYWKWLFFVWSEHIWLWMYAMIAKSYDFIVFEEYLCVHCEYVFVACFRKCLFFLLFLFTYFRLFVSSFTSHIFWLVFSFSFFDNTSMHLLLVCCL